jgi:hypothetical protein
MPEFTIDDMYRFATEAWGPLGTATVSKWKEFNDRYFDGRLRPVPVVITNTLPFGRRIAFCSYDSGSTSGRTITLNVPKDHSCLLADNDTLLHGVCATLEQRLVNHLRRWRLVFRTLGIRLLSNGLTSHLLWRSRRWPLAVVGGHLASATPLRLRERFWERRLLRIRLGHHQAREVFLE